MRKVVMYQTADGVNHETLVKAKSHATNVHASSLAKLAHMMVQDTGSRYSPAAEWLMTNRKNIEEMYKLFDDMQLAQPDDD